MTILYVGNFTQKHCTEVHIALTLESLGHNVLRIQENGYTSEELKNIISQANIDLFLFTRTWGETVKLEHLEQLRERKIPSASYHLDLYVGLERKYLHQGKTLEEVLQTDPFWRTDFVFTPDGDANSQKVFEANGVNHCYIKPGVFKPECLMVEGIERDIDVLFVGGGDRPGSANGYGHPEWPYRDRLIGWLYDTYDDRFVKYGHPQTTIRNEELNKLYARAKVVVGDSVCLPYGEFSHEYYWSDRVYETIGRGGFLIHPYIKGLEEEFTGGESIVFYEYDNFAQLKEKIDYYLEHHAEREKIRKAGHELVKEKCTYEYRMHEMLDVIDFHFEVEEMQQEGEKSIKVNLGAGSEPTDGWINVDWINQEGIQVVHNLLEFPWPFSDEIAEEIKAIDVLEHMPNYNAENQSVPIKFVEECHRILGPGGILTIQVPHWNSPNMWIDPTHVRGFDPKSMDYFDPDKDLGKWYGYYSDKKFEVKVSESNNNVTFTMKKR